MTRTRILIAAAAGVVVIGSSPWWGPLAMRHMAFFRVHRVEILGGRYLVPSDILAKLNVDTTASIWDPMSPLVSRSPSPP